MVNHFEVEASGKVSSVRIDAHAQSGGTKKLPELQQKNEQSIRPSSSWGRKLGPLDPAVMKDRAASSESTGLNQAVENDQRVTFEARADGDASQMPANANLMITLLFFAMILLVSIIPFN